jgi:hypothetical protein
MNAGQFVGREQTVGIVDVDQQIGLQELARRVVGVRPGSGGASPFYITHLPLAQTRILIRQRQVPDRPE